MFAVLDCRPEQKCLCNDGIYHFHPSELHNLTFVQLVGGGGPTGYFTEEKLHVACGCKLGKESVARKSSIAWTGSIAAQLLVSGSDAQA